MDEPLSHTTHGDAPLSSAKTPNAAALSNELDAHRGDTLVGRSVSINRPRPELYEFWRDFRNFPRFMENIEEVSVGEAAVSHWTVSAPAGRTVEWDAEISEDRMNELIAWRSLPDAGVRNSGRVEFRDSTTGRGTIVTVTVVYDPPGGSAGKLVAKLFQKEPNIQARQDLRRFKQLMETGEISTAQPPDAAPRS
jgi:uncharacterized membrane protein